MDSKGDDAAKSSQIDDNLRRVYNEVVEEQLPDRFRDLLEQLKNQDDKQGSGGSK